MAFWSKKHKSVDARRVSKSRYVSDSSVTSNSANVTPYPAVFGVNFDNGVDGSGRERGSVVSGSESSRGDYGSDSYRSDSGSHSASSSSSSDSGSSSSSSSSDSGGGGGGE